MHFAEFGVVMMLFLVGLELEPMRLWRLRGPILGLGGLQVTGTALVLFLLGWLAFGQSGKLPWHVAWSWPCRPRPSFCRPWPKRAS